MTTTIVFPAYLLACEPANPFGAQNPPVREPRRGVRRQNDFKLLQAARVLSLRATFPVLS